MNNIKYITKKDFEKVRSIVEAEIEKIPSSHNRIRFERETELFREYIKKIPSRSEGKATLVLYTKTENLGTKKWSDMREGFRVDSINGINLVSKRVHTYILNTWGDMIKISDVLCVVKEG